MPKHTFANLMHRLSQAGFKNEFVQPAILPDWWDANCARDPGLLAEVEIRVARFLAVPLSTVKNPNVALRAPTYAGAQLRRVRDVDRDRLGPAIHAAIRIAEAVVRSLRSTNPNPTIPPADGLSWRNELRGDNPTVTLDHILRDLWQRGVPVIPVEVLPSPSFQGMASIVETRPVILLGHKHDEPGRVAFLVAHEARHIAGADCSPSQPVVDEEQQIADGSEIEVRADHYATDALIGRAPLPQLQGGNFKEIANRAAQLELETGADAGAIIYGWAAQTRDYPTATRACRALYRSIGARRKVREYFDRYVDVESAAESDRQLLRCVYGEREQDETVG